MRKFSLGGHLNCGSLLLSLALSFGFAASCSEYPKSSDIDNLKNDIQKISEIENEYSLDSIRETCGQIFEVSEETEIRAKFSIGDIHFPAHIVVQKNNVRFIYYVIFSKNEILDQMKSISRLDEDFTTPMYEKLLTSYNNQNYLNFTGFIISCDQSSNKFNFFAIKEVL